MSIHFVQRFVKFSAFFLLAATPLDALHPEWYLHHTSIVTQKGVAALSEKLEQEAYTRNSGLNSSKFFVTKNLKRTKWIEEQFIREGVRDIAVTTRDGLSLNYSYFNRNSSTLLILAPGFTNPKQKLAPFVHLYPQYDLLLINFRGNEWKEEKLLDPSSWIMNPFKRIFNVDGSTTFGACEHEDVFAALEVARNPLIMGKEYTAIIGHGICYGAALLAKAQGFKEACGEKLFDALILDSQWHSMRKFIEHLQQDPWILWNPQRGGAPAIAKFIFKQRLTEVLVEKIIECKSGASIDSFSLVPYMKCVTVPTLFFYGKDDIMVSRASFEELWNACKTENKAAIITSNSHVTNHFKQKELYKLVCDLFIEKRSLSTLEMYN